MFSKIYNCITFGLIGSYIYSTVNYYYEQKEIKNKEIIINEDYIRINPKILYDYKYRNFLLQIPKPYNFYTLEEKNYIHPFRSYMYYIKSKDIINYEKHLLNNYEIFKCLDLLIELLELNLILYKKYGIYILNEESNNLNEIESNFVEKIESYLNLLKLADKPELYNKYKNQFDYNNYFWPIEGGRP